MEVRPTVAVNGKLVFVKITLLQNLKCLGVPLYSSFIQTTLLQLKTYRHELLIQQLQIFVANCVT